MVEAQVKARELTYKYLASGMTIEPAKRCSLICVANEYLSRINTLEFISEHLTDAQFQEEFNRIDNLCNNIKNEIKRI